MESVPTWGLFFLGAATAALAGLVGKYSSRLFKGKGIQEVIESANAVIQMYEKHVGALQLEVQTLNGKIMELEKKLDETLKHNEALQKLLLASPAIQVNPNE